MLAPLTPFPQVGSVALLADPETELVRIQHRNFATGDVMISFPRRFGASGNRTLPLSALQDGTPLTAAETAELDQLERAIDGKRIRSAARKAAKVRLDALQLRRIYAPILREQLQAARLPADVPAHAEPMRDAA